PHRPGLAARGGGDDAAVAAQAVAEVEPAGGAVGRGEGSDQRQQAVRGHRGAGGAVPRPSAWPVEQGGAAYVGRPLRELLARRRAVQSILRFRLGWQGWQTRTVSRWRASPPPRPRLETVTTARVARRGATAASRLGRLYQAAARSSRVNSTMY